MAVDTMARILQGRRYIRSRPFRWLEHCNSSKDFEGLRPATCVRHLRTSLVYNDLKTAAQTLTETTTDQSAWLVDRACRSST